MAKRIEMRRVGTEHCDGTGRRNASHKAWGRLKEALAAGSVIIAAGCGPAALQNQQSLTPARPVINMNAASDSKEGPEEASTDGKTTEAQEYTLLVDEMRALYHDPAANAGLLVESMGRVNVLDALYLDAQSARTMLGLVREGRYDLAVEICDKSRNMTSTLLAWMRLRTYLSYTTLQWP